MQYAIELCVVFILLFFSFVFSGSEVSILSLSDLDKLRLSREKSRRNLLILKYLGSLNKTLVTILIGNMIVNAGISILGEDLTRRYFTSHSLLYSVVIITFLVLLFGEIIPKNYAASRPVVFSGVFIWIVHGAQRIFYPLVSLTDRVVRGGGMSTVRLSREELLTAVESGENTGMDETSLSVLKNMIHFIEKPITDIMVPRSKISGIDLSERFDPEDLVREITHDLILFYESSIDHIRGYIDVTLLATVKKSVLSESLKQPLYVPETKTVFSILRDFREQSIRLAVILDEYGGTSGIVTFKNILDALIIREVLQNHYIRETGPSSWHIHGNTNISDLNDALNLDLPLDSNTVGGYVINTTGSIPSAGEKLDIVDGYMIKILRSDMKQIEWMEFNGIAR